MQCHIDFAHECELKHYQMSHARTLLNEQAAMGDSTWQLFEGSSTRIERFLKPLGIAENSDTLLVAIEVSDMACDRV